MKAPLKREKRFFMRVGESAWIEYYESDLPYADWEVRNIYPLSLAGSINKFAALSRKLAAILDGSQRIAWDFNNARLVMDSRATTKEHLVMMYDKFFGCCERVEYLDSMRGYAMHGEFDLREDESYDLETLREIAKAEESNDDGTGSEDDEIEDES